MGKEERAALKTREEKAWAMVDGPSLELIAASLTSRLQTWPQFFQSCQECWEWGDSFTNKGLLTSSSGRTTTPLIGLSTRTGCIRTRMKGIWTKAHEDYRTPLLYTAIVCQDLVGKRTDLDSIWVILYPWVIKARIVSPYYENLSMSDTAYGCYKSYQSTSGKHQNKEKDVDLAEFLFRELDCLRTPWQCLSRHLGNRQMIQSPNGSVTGPPFHCPTAFKVDD